jgi:hypothetical protein
MGFGVRRETVFAAFRAKKINFVAVPGAKDQFWVVAPNGAMNVECIPPELGRKLPGRLSEVYDVPAVWFYNPLMIPEEIKGKPS